MQHHARQWTAWPLAPVRTTPRRLRQQVAALQERLGPTVAPCKPMLTHQVLVEMPRREALVARSIQRLDLITAVHRDPLARRLADPAVRQTRLAFLLVAAAPAAERPLSHAQQL